MPTPIFGDLVLYFNYNNPRFDPALDLVLTNIPKRVGEVREGGRLCQSDHEMILLTVSCGVERVVVKEVRNWKRANWEEMREQLGRVDWKRAMRGKTAGQMWTFLKGKIHGAVRKSVSMKKVRNGGRTAWMNKELMAAIKAEEAALEGGQGRRVDGGLQRGREEGEETHQECKEEP